MNEMHFRLLFIQAMAHLNSATPMGTSHFDTDQAQPGSIRNVEMAAENEDLLIWKSIEMAKEGNIRASIGIDEIPPPRENAARSIMNEEKCGTPDISAQQSIAGGQAASPGSWPWHVGVYRLFLNYPRFVFMCSATLIRQDLVISVAGNCLSSSFYAPLTYVSLGAQSIDSPTNLIAVMDIRCHQNFFLSNNGYDICVGRLVRKMTITSNIQPSCFPTVSQAAQVNETCFMSGWGAAVSNNNGILYAFRQAQITVLSTENCERNHSSVPDDQFCAAKSSSSACLQGVGNPLVCIEDSKYVLKGVQSGYVENCGEVNENPGHFTDVTKYIDWIQEASDALKSSDRCYDATTALECGSLITQNGTILRSPITDQDKWQYPKNTDCEWKVEAPTGMNISILSICDLNIAHATSLCSDEYLEITWSTQRRQFCGALESFLVTTTTNNATIRFKSNQDELAGRGFAVQIVFNDALRTFRSGVNLILLSIVTCKLLST